MVDLARVEGSEVVIRIPFYALIGAAEYSGLKVIDAVSLAPCFARELNAEGQGEEPYINSVLDAALVRCAENADPGIAYAEPGEPK